MRALVPSAVLAARSAKSHFRLETAPVSLFHSRPSKRATSLVLLLSMAGLIGGCGDGKPQGQQQQAPPAPQVTTAKPEVRSVADFEEYVGRFVAVDYVEVRARVAGYLDSVNFSDGQNVKAGDPLFTIDRRPFLAARDQTKAALEQAKTNLKFAESDLERAESLVAGTSVTQQTLDQRRQAKGVALANLAAQEAALRQTELDLEFTELKAPISGRIGDRRVSPGNLVAGGTSGSPTLLATIVSVDPIRFEFTMDEASYIRYVRSANGEPKVGANLSVPVTLKLIDEQEFKHEGHITFIDNALDQSSGTIRGRADFPNPNGEFTPGMFGRVRVLTEKPADALLVPDKAIGTEQVKKFVYTVGADGTVASKYVTLGQLVGDMRVITSGLSADDQVIVNGMMRARPGIKVTAQPGPPATVSQN